MKTKVFLYEDNDYDVSITVTAATVLVGSRRASIIGQQHTALAMLLWGKKTDTDGKLVDEYIGNDENFSKYLIRTNTYPACIAGTVKIENLFGDAEEYVAGRGEQAPLQLSLDITPEDFMELPEELVVTWLEAIYELNPHWAPTPAPGTAPAEQIEAGEENEPAEEISSINESSPGSEPKTVQLKTNPQKRTGISTS